MMGVISAFEMACWGIIGKFLSQPIYNLLGGKYHDKLRAYSSIYRKFPENICLTIQSVLQTGQWNASRKASLHLSSISSP